MVNFAEENPFLARLRKTRHRVDYYARTHDAVSLERDYNLACARAEHRAQLARLRAAVLSLRARYLALRDDLRDTYGLEPDTALLKHLSLFQTFEAWLALDRGAPLPFRVEVRGQAYELDPLGEVRLKTCVAAYREWKARALCCRRTARVLRRQARGSYTRRVFARLRWRRVCTKWAAVWAFKQRLREREVPSVGDVGASGSANV